MAGMTILGFDAPGLWNIVDGELQYILDFGDGGFGSLLMTGDEMWQGYSIEFDVKPLIKQGEGNIGNIFNGGFPWKEKRMFN